MTGTAGDNFRTRRTALNYASGLLVTATTLAVAFVTTPLILGWLGTERYGAVRAVADWFGHLTLLEMGLGGALAPLLALARGRGDEAGFRGLLAEGIRAFAVVAAVALGAGFLLTAFVPDLVPVRADLVHDLRLGSVVAAAGLATYLLFPFRSIADASQRSYVVNLCNLAQSLTATGLAVLLAWQGFGITGQFVAFTAGQVVFYLALARDGLKRLPGLLSTLRGAPRDPTARGQLHRLNVATLLFDLSGRAGLMTDNIVIALVLGPASVVPLYLTQRLLALAQLQVQAVGNASWAALGELHARGERERFKARLVELTRLVAALSVAALVPLAAFNRSFIGLWIGAEHYGGDAVTILAAMNGYVLGLVSLWGWCFTGTGQIAVMVPAMLTSAVVNLGASVAGAYLFGLPGPLLGTLLGVTATTLWYLPARLKSHFDIPPAALARAAVGPVAWGAAPGAAIIWLAHRYPPHGWIALAASLAFSALVLLAVWWRFGLRADERGHYAERIRMALRRETA